MRNHVLFVPNKMKLFYFKQSKKSVWILLIFFSFLVNLSAQDSDSTRYTIYMDSNFQPYSFIGKNNKPEGYLVELTSDLLSSAGIEFEIKSAVWPECLKLFENDPNGIIFNYPGMTYNKEVVTSDAVFYFRYCLISRNSEPYASLQSLVGKRLFMLKDKKYPDDFDYSQVRKIEGYYIKDGLSMLMENRCDAVICPYQMGNNILSEKGFSSLSMNVLLNKQVGYALSMWNSQQAIVNKIDSAYSQIENSDVTALYMKWFSPKRPDYKKSHFNILAITLASVLFILIILLHLYRYRRLRASSKHLISKNVKMEMAARASGSLLWTFNVSKGVISFLYDFTLFKPTTLTEFAGLVTDNEREEFLSVMYALVRGEIKNKEITIKVMFGDDSWHYLNCHIKVLFEDGKPVEVIGISKDITEDYVERKNIDQLFRKFQTIFNTISVGLFVFDDKGIIIDANPEGLKLFGLEKDVLINKKWSFYDDQILSSKFNNIESVMENHIFDTKYNFDLLPDSTRKGYGHLKYRCDKIRSKDGSVTGMVISFFDITDDILLSDRYNQLFKESSVMLDNIPVSISFYDSDTRLLFFNNSYRSLFGISDDSAYLSDYPSIRNSVFEKIKKGLLDSVSKGEPFDFELMLDFDDPDVTRKYHSNLKGVKYISGKLRMLYGNDDKVEKYVLLVSDITESRKMTNDLEKMSMDLRNVLAKTISSNRLYNALIDALPCIFFLKNADDDFRYISANKLFCESIGLTEADVTGKTDFEICTPKEAEECRASDVDTLQLGHIQKRQITEWNK